MRFAPVSFVSVVFESEFLLLRLQAASMRTYLPAELVSDIIVIDNSRKGMPKGFRGTLLLAYGELADKVRILRPSEICTLPGTLGWRSQQVLKLVVAEQLTSPRYVVLDAKNHFVSPARPDYFQSPDGRARVNSYGYQTHPLRPGLEHVLRYLEIYRSDYIDEFPATVTPFVLDTEIVLALTAGLAAKSGHDFSVEFVDNNLLEFFLYSGWIIASGRSLGTVFDFHQVFCPNIWPKNVNATKVREAVGKAADRSLPLFSIHRRALGRLDAEGVHLLAEFWTERELFATSADAERFVREFKRAFLRAEVVRKLREERLQAIRMVESGWRRISGLATSVRRRIIGPSRSDS